jgi:hypothetical protein
MTGEKGLRRLAIGLIACAAMLAMATGTAYAAGPLDWGTPQAVGQDAPFAWPNRGVDVSCPTASDCTVLTHGAGEFFEGRTVSTSNAGEEDLEWTAGSVVDSSFRTQDLVQQLDCPEAGKCVAVGYDGAYASVDADTEDPHWIETELDLTAYRALSCPSVNLCVAGDRDGRVSISVNPFSATPSWVRSGTLGMGQLEGVSCASTAFCVIAGTNGKASTSTNPSAPSPAWSAPATISATAIQSLSCPTTGMCAAIDAAGNAKVTTNPTATTPVWRTSDANTSSNSDLEITCPSTHLCLVTDIFSASISVNPTHTIATWRSDGLGPGHNVYHSGDCPTADLCLLTGTNDPGVNDFAGAGAARTLNARSAAPSWNVTTADPNGMNSLYEISCPNADFCGMLVAHARFGATTDPESSEPEWTEPHGTYDDPFFSGVSDLACPSSGLCLTAAFNRIERTLDPADNNPVWTAQHNLSPAEIEQISCPSTSLCVTTDSDAHAVVSTNPLSPTPTWTRSPGRMTATGQVEGLDCPSTSLCVASLSTGGVIVSENPASAAAPWSAPSDVPLGGSLQDPSCSGVVCGIASITGSVAVTADVTADPPVWRSTKLIDEQNHYVSDIACAANRCTAVGVTGEVFTTTNAGGGNPVWQDEALLDAPIYNIDCVAAPVCAASTTERAITGFAPAVPRHTLSVAKTGEGSGTVSDLLGGIQCGEDCAETVLSGTPMVLTAAASPGSEFTGWSGPCSGTGPCTVLIGQDTEVRANFAPGPEPETRYLSIETSGNGTGKVISMPPAVICPPMCFIGLQEGITLTLAATPDMGSVFAGWSGDGSCSGKGPCTVTMSQNREVEVVFNQVANLPPDPQSPRDAIPDQAMPPAKPPVRAQGRCGKKRGVQRKRCKRRARRQAR